MKFQMILTVIFVLALTVPLTRAASVEPAEAEKSVEGSEDSGSESAESTEPKQDIVANDYFIDVNDITPAPTPWWW